MFTGSFKLFRSLVQTIRGEDSPKQIAMGIAMGMLLGLTPPDNLIAVFFGTLILATRVNVFAAIVSTFAFAWAGAPLDPIFHRIGALVLSADFMEPLWTMLYEARVVPWTRFNNTVVMGSLVFGLAIFYPVYYISFSLISKYGPPAHKQLSKNRVYRRLAGVKEDLPEGTTS